MVYGRLQISKFSIASCVVVFWWSSGCFKWSSSWFCGIVTNLACVSTWFCIECRDEPLDPNPFIESEPYRNGTDSRDAVRNHYHDVTPPKSDSSGRDEPLDPNPGIESEPYRNGIDSRDAIRNRYHDVTLPKSDSSGSEDCDEKREMEPRHEPNREATPTLPPRSPVVHRQRERIVGFEEVPNKEGSMRGRNAEGIRPSEIEAENKGVNLAPLLAAHLRRNESGQPLRSSLTSVQGGHQPSTNMGNLPLNDHGHDTNQCQELKHQVEDVVKSGQLVHLVKRVKKKEKISDTQLGKWKKGEKDATPVEAPILMIRIESYNPRKRPAERNNSKAGEITFLKYKFCRSSHHKSLRVRKTIEQGISGWKKLMRGYDSPHNIILTRTAMQQMGIVMSTIHGAIKFYTPQGISTVLSQYNPREPKEEQRETSEEHHKKATANKNQNKVTRPPEYVRRRLRMDYRTHDGSPKNSNNRRRNLQHRAQNKRAQTLGTSEAEEEKPGNRKKQSDSHPSRGAYKG
uniref:Reverse transcriptase domain-containing protein n=1 Tax=Tanacetum cinerariifolium TaxID=118510 RepID=A0A6L2P2B7_TANCI|nr:hypothetical protein [Tanacetum cinerariifolium]